MQSIVGIFRSRVNAERAAERLKSLGILERNINLLTPGNENDLQRVPIVEGEQPGMGKAVGAVVGGALGAATASLFLPGVGPVVAIGTVAAALLGAAVGAAGGAAAGAAMEESLAQGMPVDEMFIYEDALRRGRSIVITFVEDDKQHEQATGILLTEGAESLDAARESWWVGLRDVESEHYHAHGRDFTADEMKYRRGFEAALSLPNRGQSYEENEEHLRRRYPDLWRDEAFRFGYNRGVEYQDRVREQHRKETILI
ncbi:MAG TPA: hypothetical protein VGK99_21465 [Acidobacteriota bacterium]|jgi:hypothetical protein